MWLIAGSLPTTHEAVTERVLWRDTGTRCLWHPLCSLVPVPLPVLGQVLCGPTRLELLSLEAKALCEVWHGNKPRSVSWVALVEIDGAYCSVRSQTLALSLICRGVSWDRVPGECGT